MRVFRIFLVVVAASGWASQARGQEIEAFSVPAFAKAGEQVEAVLVVGRDDTSTVELEIVEFHYFHHPELAPEPDRWPHDRQMAHMKDVLEGRAQAYQPSLDDPKVRQILDSRMPRRRLPMERREDGSYRARWTAGHGRFYLRPYIDGQAADRLASLRVHCSQPRLDVIRHLADLVERSRQAAEERQSEQALALLSQADGAFRKGHGLRFMLTHHGFDPAPIEDGLSQACALTSSKPIKAASLLSDLLKRLQEMEGRFRQIEL